MNKITSKNNFYLLIILSAFLYYIIFILRTSVVIGGTTYFTLFDDAMISMRYARNFAEGIGLVWNPGEYVEGYSNLLWVIWMSILHLLPFHESKLSLLVSLSGAVILVLNLLVVKSLSLKLTKNSFLATSLSVFFTAFYFGLIFWTLRGMEVGLLTLLSNYAMLLLFNMQEDCKNKNYIKFIAVLGCIILLRSDSLVLVIFFLTCFYFTVSAHDKFKKFSIITAVMLAVIFLQTLFRYIYYDDLLPNTFYLKLGDVPLYDRAYRGYETLRNIFSARLLPLLLPVILYLIFYYRQIEKKKVFCLLGLFITTMLYSFYVGGDSWEWMPYTNRFITLSIPALIILFSLSIEKLFYKFKSQKVFFISSAVFLFYVLLISAFFLYELPEYQITPGNPWINVNVFLLLCLIGFIFFTGLVIFVILNRAEGKIYHLLLGLFVAAICILAFFITNEYSYSIWFKKNAFFVEEDISNLRLGLMLNKHTGEDARIADVWAGTAPYFSKRYSIDLLGKMDKFIAKSKPAENFFLPGHSKWNHVYSISKYKPDLILHLKESNPDGELKSILENDYELLPKGFYGRKGSVNFDKQFFK